MPNPMILSDAQVIAGFGAALAILLAVLLLRRKSVRPEVDEVPRNAILVDGSNVMHWGGEPSVMVLSRVLAALEFDGHAPCVCFDANVGYKLWGKYCGSAAIAARLGLPEHQVYVVEKGVVADEVLLDLATTHHLNIVTNDRFRDWAVQYPWVKNYKRFRRGEWREGSVVWQ